MKKILFITISVTAGIAALLASCKKKSSPAPDSPGIINTIAGNGNLGYSGDGGSAITAALYNPSGIAVDNAGNVYIADAGNNVVRKVNSGGIISTIAGNGLDAGTGGGAYSGDGGPATAAELNNPTGVAVDGSGNVYIADFGNDRIRIVNTAGVINTFAGTGFDAASGNGGYGGDGSAATAAELYWPCAIVVDKQGNVYFADNRNECIRKVNTSGIINTVAGTGAAGYSGDGGPATAGRINNPTGLAVDNSGNIYIADAGNNAIRKVNTSGIISSIAGNGAMGYNGDGIPALTASLNAPYGVCVDNTGNVYVADASSARIREINTAGIISTVAGNGTVGFIGDGGPALSAEFSLPQAIILDASGNMYIADVGNQRVREVNK